MNGETCIKKDQVKFIQAPKKKIQAIENNTSRIQVQYKLSEKGPGGQLGPS